MIPGMNRHPLKKLAADQEALLELLQRWRDEAMKTGHRVGRTVVAFEAGRDGFWLARWLQTHDTEAYVIHPTSVAVSREHRRAKTDRLDTELLKRAFLWMAARRTGPLQDVERFRRSRRRMPSVPTENARAWSASAPESSTGSKAA